MENKEEAEESADESSKESNEEGEGSSSEADEMAAALEAELNDFMWRRVPGEGLQGIKPQLSQQVVPKIYFSALELVCS